jgi:hypothetical protein
MRWRRETVEHPFGIIKARRGATHFLTKTLPRVATEMALHLLGYGLTSVMNTAGVQPLVAAMRTWPSLDGSLACVSLLPKRSHGQDPQQSSGN